MGRIVIYRSRTGVYSVPAIVAATIDDLVQANVDAGHIPALDDGEHLHLVCFTPGTPGQVSARTASEHPELVARVEALLPHGGTFHEWNVPYAGDPADYGVQPPGTWAWPPRT